MNQEHINKVVEIRKNILIKYFHLISEPIPHEHQTDYTVFKLYESTFFKVDMSGEVSDVTDNYSAQG